MTNTEAHAVIAAAVGVRRPGGVNVFDDSTLQILDPFVDISDEEETEITLDGDFSPELLEAIVCYIKDRKGVANAHVLPGL